jgi:hypothetical protein
MELKMSNEKQQQKHQPQPRQPQDEQNMNKKMARSKDQGLHTKNVGDPDNE